MPPRFPAERMAGNLEVTRVLSHTSPHPAREAWHSALSLRIPAQLLVASGIVMFAWYIVMDVTASLRYDGYSYTDWTISELSAIGAPTRGMWIAAGAVYQLLAFAFAFGVLRMAGRQRTLAIAGWILLVAAVVGPLWWFAPMHQRAVLAAGGGDWRDTMHLVLAGVSSLEFFAVMGVAAFAFGRGFRAYTFAAIAVMFGFGMLMNTMVNDVTDNVDTPWLGIWERITVEGAMLWQAVFAAVLIRHGRQP